MKVLTWNIAGAHTFTGAIEDALSYEKEDLKYFTDEIKKTEAEVILLQEVHIADSKNEPSHTEIIARSLNYSYFKDHPYGKSHIKNGNHLALATISKFSIINSYFYKLPNPNLTIKRPNGNTWVSFDVGFLITEIDYHGVQINIANCHLVPFHYFERDFSESAFQDVRDDIAKLLIKLVEKSSIIGGDFNYNNLKTLLPSVFIDKQYQEVFENIETTPGRGQQDHVLYSDQWKLQAYDVQKSSSDHYKCIADLVLKSN